MNSYEVADLWAIVESKDSEFTGYKVLASFLGGYLTGDRWRLNSGIVGVEDRDATYLIHGRSGSVYCCPKNGYGMSHLAEMEINRIIAASPLGAGRVLSKEEAFAVIKRWRSKGGAA